MSQVIIRKFHDAETIQPTFTEQMAAMEEAIRIRAFNLFENRHGVDGSALDDWLQAERELIAVTPVELIEEDSEIKARIAMPGVNRNEIGISVTPDALVVHVETIQTLEGEEDHVHLVEFSGNQVFRRIELPASIDVDKISASLDHGVLYVVAPKAAPAVREEELAVV